MWCWPEIVTDGLDVGRHPDQVGLDGADHDGVPGTVDVPDDVGLALLQEAFTFTQMSCHRIEIIGSNCNHWSYNSLFSTNRRLQSVFMSSIKFDLPFGPGLFILHSFLFHLPTVLHPEYSLEQVPQENASVFYWKKLCLTTKQWKMDALLRWLGWNRLK